MVISQASDTVMIFVDRLFLSCLGEAYLAASMSGGLTAYMTCSLFIGTVSYGTAIVGQYYGAGRTEKCAQATFQAMLLALASYPVLLALSPLASKFFTLVGQSPLQVELGYTYFKWLMFGGAFLVLRFALAGFFVGIGRTTVVMAANAAGMLINVPLNYMLIFGKLGMPALGLRGAALGTILGNATCFAILLAFYLRKENRETYGTYRARKLDPPLLRTLVRFGVPAGFEMLLNVAAFNLFVQLMHSYGTGVAAAVTIALNWDIVAFIPMLGMGHATTALVAQHMGAGDHQGVRKAAMTALKVAWVYSSCMVLLFVLGTHYLVGVFLPGTEADGAGIRSMAAVMLRLAAFYILADSAQLVFAGALRGAGDTRWVMLISVGLHWVFSLAAIALIRVLRVGPEAVWVFFIVFVIGLGISMFARFRSAGWEKIDLIHRKS